VRTFFTALMVPEEKDRPVCIRNQCSCLADPRLSVIHLIVTDLRKNERSRPFSSRERQLPQRDLVGNAVPERIRPALVDLIRSCSGCIAVSNTQSVPALNACSGDETANRARAASEHIIRPGSAQIRAREPWVSARR
jgi:hypothetical protein